MIEEVKKFLEEKAQKNHATKEIGFVPQNKDELYVVIDYVSKKHETTELSGQAFEDERIRKTRESESKRYGAKNPSSYLDLHSDEFMHYRISRQTPSKEEGRDF